MNGNMHACISGWGMALPERILTNQELAQTVDTSDDWVVSRTGIRERRIAGEKESTATLAIQAARAAIKVAGVPPTHIDLVIVATATPEHIFPTTANLVQDSLGASRAGAFDLSAGCSGFVYALTLADQAIRSGSARHILVIGAETMSRITDWQDRNTCILFGDGAGAVLLSGSSNAPGIASTVLGSDGSGANLLIIPAGGSRLPASADTVSNGQHYIKMDGREVFRFATQILAAATREALAKAGWKMDEVALIIPHQANIRIVEAAAKKLNLPQEHFYLNLEHYGNTSAASVPIAICEAVTSNRLHNGDKIVLAAFGAGLSWAAAALTWGTDIAAQPWWHRLSINLHLDWAALRSYLRRQSRRIPALFVAWRQKTKALWHKARTPKPPT